MVHHDRLGRGRRTEILKISSVPTVELDYESVNISCQGMQNKTTKEIRQYFQLSGNKNKSKTIWIGLAQYSERKLQLYTVLENKSYELCIMFFKKL